jgi:hypothetical protein
MIEQQPQPRLGQQIHRTLPNQMGPDNHAHSAAAKAYRSPSSPVPTFPDISATLTTTVFDRSSSRWLGISDLIAGPEGLPLSYSLAQPCGPATLVFHDPEMPVSKLWSDCALRICERALAPDLIARAPGRTRLRYRSQRALGLCSFSESFFGCRDRIRRGLAVHRGGCTLARRRASSGQCRDHGVNAILHAVNLKRARSSVAGPN